MEKLVTIQYDQYANEIIIINQTKLPGNLEYKTLKTLEDVWIAINHLEVRGAPLIGITAAYGLAMHIKKCHLTDKGLILNEINKAKVYLGSARPTAVNLENALKNMTEKIAEFPSAHAIQVNLIERAFSLHDEDKKISECIGHFGADILPENGTVLTYCNAGLLATGNHLGTALAPVYTALSLGKKVEVYACETRPVLQGARLTTFELVNAGVPTTLIADNMIGWLLSTKKIDAIFVGCDRVAKNGDFANKIGTHTLAVLAKAYRVPFYVCTPSTTIDFDAASKEDIVIEYRDAEEIRSMWYKKPMVDNRVNIINPSFDCTGAEFVTGFITERGIIQPPFTRECFR